LQNYATLCLVFLFLGVVDSFVEVNQQPMVNDKKFGGILKISVAQIDRFARGWKCWLAQANPTKTFLGRTGMLFMSKIHITSLSEELYKILRSTQKTPSFRLHDLIACISMPRMHNIPLVLLSTWIMLVTSSRRIQSFSAENLSRHHDVPFQAYQDVQESHSKNENKLNRHSQPEQVRFVWERLPARVAQDRAVKFYHLMQTRRTVRFFDEHSKQVPLELIQTCIATAGTAPSGAHQQPWTFCVVQNPVMKQQIREFVEQEEQLNYEKRMSETWKDQLKPIMSGLHTDESIITKPYLTEAPYIIVMMKQVDGGIDEESGKTIKHYYAEKSCGIAAGMLCAALHNANLATLCSTPMHAEEAIRQLLGRPSNERVFLLMPVGYPSEDCTVPYRDEMTLRKSLDDVMKIF
jgi:iodotyrosine deiodinase